ncbi:MAG: LysM peptidoglycan-binding domain-containing protein [Bacteroidetes bacterium]|nr:MAG: LysM peptidoglycan-binding domain-containing protein [Bacteroidota bacterium]
MKLYFILYPLMWMFGGTKPAPEPLAYIEQYRMLAMLEQQRTGVPAAITMAQGLHESGAGKGPLALRSNNHFGIKCKSNWTGPTVYHNDDEEGECFRAYATVYESYKDHSDFLRNSGRYAALFSYDLTDYVAWAKGLKAAGYATNPRYAEILIKTIENYNLNALTELALQGIADSTLTTEPQLPDSQLTNTTATHFKSAPMLDLSNAEAGRNSQPSVSPRESYPQGIFTINGSRVLFVTEPTSLLALANTYGLSLGTLIRYNDLPAQSLLAENQLVFIERKKARGSLTPITILPGQSLWEVAQQKGLPMQPLLQSNPNMAPYTAVQVSTVLKMN